MAFASDLAITIAGRIRKNRQLHSIRDRVVIPQHHADEQLGPVAAPLSGAGGAWPWERTGMNTTMAVIMKHFIRLSSEAVPTEESASEIAYSSTN